MKVLSHSAVPDTKENKSLIHFEASLRMCQINVFVSFLCLHLVQQTVRQQVSRSSSNTSNEFQIAIYKFEITLKYTSLIAKLSYSLNLAS